MNIFALFVSVCLEGKMIIGGFFELFGSAFSVAWENLMDADSKAKARKCLKQQKCENFSCLSLFSKNDNFLPSKIFTLLLYKGPDPNKSECRCLLLTPLLWPLQCGTCLFFLFCSLATFYSSTKKAPFVLFYELPA